MAKPLAITPIAPTSDNLLAFLKEAQALDANKDNQLSSEEIDLFNEKVKRGEASYGPKLNFSELSAQEKRPRRKGQVSFSQRYEAAQQNNTRDGADPKQNADRLTFADIAAEKNANLKSQLLSFELTNRLLKKIKLCSALPDVCDTSDKSLDKEAINKIYLDVYQDFFDEYTGLKAKTNDPKAKTNPTALNEAINYFIQFLKDENVGKDTGKLAIVGELLVRYLHEVNYAKDRQDYVQQHLAILSFLKSSLKALESIQNATLAKLDKNITELNAKLDPLKTNLEVFNEDLKRLEKVLNELTPEIKALTELIQKLPPPSPGTSKDFEIDIEDLAKKVADKIQTILKIKFIDLPKDLKTEVPQQLAPLVIVPPLHERGLGPRYITVPEKIRLDEEGREWWIEYRNQILPDATQEREGKKVNNPNDPSLKALRLIKIKQKKLKELIAPATEQSSPKSASASIACGNDSENPYKKAVDTILAKPDLLAKEIQSFLKDGKVVAILNKLKNKSQEALQKLLDEAQKLSENMLNSSLSESFLDDDLKNFELFDLLQGLSPTEAAEMLGIIQSAQQLLKKFDLNNVEALQNLISEEVQDLLEDPDKLTQKILEFYPKGRGKQNAKEFVKTVKDYGHKINAITHLFGFGDLGTLLTDPDERKRTRALFEAKLALYLKDPESFMINVGNDTESLLKGLAKEYPDVEGFQKGSEIVSQVNSIVRHIFSTKDWGLAEFITFGSTAFGGNMAAAFVKGGKFNPLIASSAFLLNLNVEIELARRGWALPELVGKINPGEVSIINDMEIPIATDHKWYQFGAVVGQGYTRDFRDSVHPDRVNVRTLLRYTMPFPLQVRRNPINAEGEVVKTKWKGKVWAPTLLQLHPYAQVGGNYELWHNDQGKPTGVAALNWGAGLRLFFNAPKAWKPFVRLGYEGDYYSKRPADVGMAPGAIYHSVIFSFGLADPWNSISDKKKKAKP